MQNRSGMVPEFSALLACRHTAEFRPALQQALQTLGAEQLPLLACTGQGGRVDADSLTVTVNRVVDEGTTIVAAVEVFFTETVGGCSCADDPYTRPAYGELRVVIDAQTGAADITVSTDNES